MSTSVKVAISLPPAMFEVVEQARQDRKESRSEFFRQAILAFLRELSEKADIERYVQGYRRHPESEEEVDLLDADSAATLAGEPWE